MPIIIIDIIVLISPPQFESRYYYRAIDIVSRVVLINIYFYGINTSNIKVEQSCGS